ncbi:MAG: hypothetical protein R3192_04535 [Woeseiaceae bacterium]|nr:hypothetical protein [Woeseiaceae bacterium]
MTSENKWLRFFADRDWRIWAGAIVTILWITAGVWYINRVSDTTPTQFFSLDTVGNFLEGAFAPLAFMWLVIGLFIQQQELANNTEAIRKTSEQSEKQTQAIAATEMNARQETFFKIAESVRHQLGGISGMLLVSGLGPVGSGRFDRQQSDALFEQAAKGDYEVFARMFMTMEFLEEGGLEQLFYGTEIRTRHTKNFMRTFERLCRLAKNCDVDGIIEDALMQNAFGLLYRRMKNCSPEPVESGACTPKTRESAASAQSEGASAAS